MSDQHTLGQLKVIDGTIVLFARNAGGFDIRNCPDAEANARRLVACWNALLDVPTELLERAVSAGITDVSMGNLFSSRMELQAQRDELLAALRVVQSQCESMAGADWRKWEELASPEEFERWVKSRAAHMAEQARAAIAKVEGGAA